MFMPHRPERPPKSEGGKKFQLVSDYQPSGDQPTAIAELVAQIDQGERDQVLLGVTGPGKTFTMAKVIEAVQRPALVLAPRSEEHTSELQSLMRISYAVFCLKKKNSNANTR